MKSSPLRDAARYVYFLFLAGLILPCLSLPVFLLLEQSNAFARSGSLMVAISIALVYLNHFYTQDSALNEKLEVGAAYLADKMPDALPLLKERLDPEALAAFEELEITSMDDLAERAKNTTAGEALVSRFSRRAEFGLGIAGTVIWGFGDLVWFSHLVVVLLICIGLFLFWYREVIIEAIRNGT